MFLKHLQKLDKDLYTVKTSSHPFDELLQNIEEESRLEIRPSDFVGRGVQHPLFSMMRWYFKSRNAICFTTGVTLRQKYGRKIPTGAGPHLPLLKIARTRLHKE